VPTRQQLLDRLNKKLDKTVAECDKEENRYKNLIDLHYKQGDGADNKGNVGH